MIRAATTEDIPRLVEMGTRFWTETVYATRLPPVSQAAIALLLTQMLATATSAVFVAERDGLVIGMIGLALYQHPFTGALTAGELFWWVEPESRGQGVRLLSHAERWARECGARALQMIAPTPEVERLYERLGYRYLEAGYQKAIA